MSAGFVYARRDVLRCHLRRRRDRSAQLREMRDSLRRGQLLHRLELRGADLYRQLRERHAVLRKHLLRLRATVLRHRGG